jgi:hypothetical protein
MFKPLFGRIKFFDNRHANLYGYITPDKQRPDGKDYYFLLSSARKLIEEVVGEVAMKIDASEDIRPKKNDRVVFESANYEVGPTAITWNSEAEWIRAKSIIARRPWKECFLSRVVEQDVSTNKKTTIWEGPKVLLFELLQKGNADFLQDLNEWYRKFYCEEFRVEGWRKIANPLTTEFKLRDTAFQITTEQRMILDDPRFKIREGRR